VTGWFKKINLFKNNKKELVVATLFFCLIFFTYRFWLFSDGIITDGDWPFYFKETMSTVRVEYFSAWLSDRSLGRVVLDLAQAPFYAMYGFFSKYLNLDYSMSERIIHFIPVALLTPLFSFIFLRYNFKLPISAFIGSIVYSYNVYSLQLQTGHVTLASALMVAPLAVYYYQKNLKNLNLSTSIKTAFVFFIVSSFETRMFYVIAWILFFYFLVDIVLCLKSSQGWNKKLIFKKVFFGGLPVALFALLSFYWIISLLKTPVESTILGRDLFGSEYLDIFHSLAIYHPFWTGGEPVSFSKNPVPFWLWLVPVFAFLGLVLNNKNPKVLFFGLTGLLGILLSKQEYVPFPGLYPWLYENFPGFSAFREATKFYFLVQISYTFLCAGFIEWLWSNQVHNLDLKKTEILRYGLSAVLTVILLFNLKPFMTQEAQTLFVKRSVPSDYIIFKNILQEQEGKFRTLWAPRDSRWSFYTDQKGRLSLAELSGMGLNSLNNQEMLEMNRPEDLVSPEDRMLFILQQNYSDYLIDSLNIKYIAVPVQDDANDDNFFNPEFFIKGGREYFIQELEKLDYLERLNVGFQELAVFENKDYQPFINANNNMVQLESLINLSEKSEFVEKHITKGFPFTLQDADTVELTGLVDIINSKSIDTASSRITAQKEISFDELFINNAQNELAYEYKEGTLNIKKINMSGLFISNQKVTEKQEEVIYTRDLEAEQDYILQFGNISQEVQEGEFSIGSASQYSTLRLYHRGQENLIENGDFESGIDYVAGDCNNFDNTGIVQAEITDTNPSSGSQSLELMAVRHIACINMSGDIDQENDYYLELDYKTPDSYRVWFDILQADEIFERTKKITAGRKERVSLDVRKFDEWDTYNQLINTIEGTKKIRVSLFSYGTEDLDNQVFTYFDNLRLNELELLESIDINPSEDNFIKADIGGQSIDTSNSLHFQGERYPINNSIVNGSFEDGFWREKVGDCNRFNDDIRMSMDMDTSIKSDGEQSLKLSAETHIACTNKVFPVQENSLYSFNFDYLSENSDFAGYRLEFKGAINESLEGLPEGFKDIEEKIPVEELKTWNTFEKLIHTPADTKFISLTIYTYSKDNKTNIVNYYDNFNFIKIPDLIDKFYFINGSAPENDSLPDISMTQDTMTRKNIVLSSIKNSFFLNMSESFNPGWEIILQNSKLEGFIGKNYPFISLENLEVKGVDQLKYNSLINSWYFDVDQLCEKEGFCSIDENGLYSMNISIEFYPQRWLNFGLLISLSGGVLMVAFLCYDYIEKKRRRLKERRPGNEDTSQ
jgi:hypothetical protein